MKCKKSLRPGFTMAEVLITLGVIGIVAAMTLPGILTNYQKQSTVARLKKVYSVLANAIKLSEYNNGEMADWEFPKNNYDENMYIFFRKYYLPYLKDASECLATNCYSKEKYNIYTLSGADGNGLRAAQYMVKLNDGTYLYFLPNTPNGYIWMFADINGHQKPNTIGKDIFVFDIYGYPNTSNRKNYRLKFWGEPRTSEQLSGLGDYVCNKNSHAGYSGFYCGALILKNGWKMPADYPW